MKISGFDAQRFERLVESVRTITTFVARTARHRAAGLSSRAYSTWLLQDA